jgi:hypothetical protein
VAEAAEMFAFVFVFVFVASPLSPEMRYQYPSFKSTSLDSEAKVIEAEMMQVKPSDVLVKYVGEGGKTCW